MEEKDRPVEIIIGNVLPRLEDGSESASIGDLDTATIGTYGVGRTGMTMKCKFCEKPKKELCDCFKEFPKDLAREMAIFLPPAGAGFEKMEVYLKKIETKETDTRRRAEAAARKREVNGEASEPVYPCLVCETPDARGHICKGEYVPKEDLLLWRNELEKTSFQYIGALDTYLHSDPNDNVKLVNTWQQGTRQVERLLEEPNRQVEEEPVVSLLCEQSFVKGILCCVHSRIYLYFTEDKEAQKPHHWIERAN